VYRSFCKFRFGRWQEAALRRHDAMTLRKENAHHGNACRNQPPLETAYAVLLEHGLDGAGKTLRILVDEAAKIERSAFLSAAPYERTATCRDDANGFKSKTMLTRVGKLTF